MYYGRYVQGQQTVVQRALAHTMAIAEESIGNFRVVKQFAQVLEGGLGFYYSGFRVLLLGV